MVLMTTTNKSYLIFPAITKIVISFLLGKNAGEKKNYS
jgi:hypothetical protein